jgi:hypothetical protein
MPPPVVPFSVTVNETGFTATQSIYYVGVERRVMGMLRLEEERLVVQTTELRKQVRVSDAGYQEVTETDDVSERLIPLASVADAHLRRRWLGWELLLTGADLRAFAGLPGAAGLEMRLRVERRHRAAAADLVATLRLQLAELALRRAEAARPLPG